MEINEIKQQIKTGEFDKFYVFYGCEHAIMKIYIKMMAEKGNYQITYADSLMDLMSGAKTKSLIKNPHLYIIMDDKEFLTNEKMWQKFEGLKDDVVIFYYTSADKRLKFWKSFKDRAVEFGKLSDRTLIKYIQKEVPLNEDNCRTLIDACDSDYGRILLEIDKIVHFRLELDNETIISPDLLFETLLNEGAIYRAPYDAIFDFVGAVLERIPAKALNLLEKAYGVNEANLTLLSVLYNNFKLLLQIQSSTKPNKDAWKVKAYKGNYTNGEIIRAMKIIRTAEKGIKTGQIADEYSVYYALVNIM